MMTLSMNENEMKIFWRHWFWEPIRTNYIVVVGCGLLCGCRGGWHTWTQSAHHTSPASKDWSDPWMVVVVVVMCRTLMKSCIQVCVKTCNTAKKLRVVCVKLGIKFKTLLLNDQARQGLKTFRHHIIITEHLWNLAKLFRPLTCGTSSQFEFRRPALLSRSGLKLG